MNSTPISMPGRPYPKGHPHYFHIMMGGRPWMRRGGTRIERIYFNQFAVRGYEWFVQGREIWKRQGPAQFTDLTDEQIERFPIGYFDVQEEKWVIEHWLEQYWPGSSYSDFMNASIARRTFAPMVAPKEVKTRDGLLMEEGLELMFVGGKIHQRYHWSTEALLGRRMIAWCRAARWQYGPDGKFFSYGDRYIKVKERAHPSEPKCWWVVPAPGDDDFLIPGRNADTTHSWLPIQDPEISLVTIDGRRLSPVIQKLPMKTPVFQE